MAQNRSKRTRAIYSAEDELREVLNLASSDDVREYVAFGSVFDIPLELKFGNIESVQRYVDSVTSMSWFPESRKVTVKRATEEGKYQGKPRYLKGSASIHIPDHGGGVSSFMREEIILHELAHHISEKKESHEVGSGFLPALRMLFYNRFGGSIQSLFDIFLMERGINPHE